MLYLNEVGMRPASYRTEASMVALQGVALRAMRRWCHSVHSAAIEQCSDRASEIIVPDINVQSLAMLDQLEFSIVRG